MGKLFSVIGYLILVFIELGISYGTAIIILIALYFIIKWGVKNGIKQYFEEKEQEEKMSRKRK